jgi:membrane peptidoglycan carboxypeptidase
MGRLARLLKRCLILGGIGALLAYMALYLAPLPAPPRSSAVPESVNILDREGRLLYDSAGPGDVHYTYVPLPDIAERLKQAVVATEDATFYSNPGIDLRAITRAALTDLRAREPRQGGSTITQQLARNIYFAPEERSSASPLRKISEIALALRLDRSMSKDEILEEYLNRVYFGNLAFGVEAASRTYFGKSVRDLDLAESALLAGLPQSPADYDPFTKISAAKSRQRTVLDRMLQEGYITAAEAEAAWAEPLVALFARFVPKGVYEYTYFAQATTPGRFNVPPATAYEQYFPEVWGRTDSGSFVVTEEQSTAMELGATPVSQEAKVRLAAAEASMLSGNGSDGASPLPVLALPPRPGPYFRRMRAERSRSGGNGGTAATEVETEHGKEGNGRGARI